MMLNQADLSGAQQVQAGSLPTAHEVKQEGASFPEETGSCLSQAFYSENLEEAAISSYPLALSCQTGFTSK